LARIHVHSLLEMRGDFFLFVRHLFAAPFFNSSGLWAASLPLLSDFTRYSGSSLEADTLWLLILVSSVSFFSTMPSVLPYGVSHETWSPFFNASDIARSFF